MTWDSYASALNQAADFLKSKIGIRPDIGLILGSGLGGYGSQLADPVIIPYSEVPGLLAPTVPGHTGQVIFGKVGARTVFCLSGRVHAYEGLQTHEIQFGARLLALVGCRLVILTAAVGGSDASYKIGSLVPIVDHVNFLHRSYTSPIGEFSHLIQTNSYATSLHSLVSPLTGVYAQDPGPTYETPLEVASLTTTGVTLFGMSTVPEVIALKELGVPVLAVGFVSNLAAGLSETPLSHEDVTAAVKASEGEVAATITKAIGEAPLTDFPIPTFTGNPFNVVPPAYPFSEVPAIEAAIDALLPGQTVDAVIVLGGKHSLPGFTSAGEVPLANLEGFPIAQNVNAKVAIGAFAGKTVAVVSGASSLCGFAAPALHFLAVAFKHLGATAFVQTFHTGGFGESGVSLVEGIVTAFEAPNPVPFFRPFGEAPPTAIKKSVLAAYHGPEFPTAFEAGFLKRIGATQVTLGTSQGLLIARALELQSIGIADGSFTLPLTADDTLSALLANAAAASDAVGKAVETLLAPITANGAKPFTAGPGGKALAYNDARPLAQNEQEEPAAVDALAASLPKADGIIFFFSANPKQFKAWAEGKTPLPIEKQTIYEITVADRPVLLAVRDRTLVRAAAKLGLPILLLSSGFATSPDAEHGKVVCAVDHINISGVSPLFGRNKSGLRFPGAEGLYRQVPGVPGVKVFWLPDFRQAVPGNKEVARALGADIVTGLGPSEAIVARHAGAKNVAHLFFQVQQFQYWTIPEELVAAGLFASAA
jgi:purine-nucleoside phosphorylase